MIKLCKTLFFAIISCTIQAQDAQLKRADSLYIHGNYSKAIEVFKIYEHQDEVYEKIAKAYLALGNYDLAVQNYDHALLAFPEDALIKNDYAKLLSQTKKLNDAAVLFSELVYLDYKNPNYHYELGLVFEKQGDSTAMSRFYSAFELDPTHQKAIQKIARHFLVKRKHESSLRFVNTGLESYANNTDLINLKALNYYWKEDYKEAAIWYEKLLTLGENSQYIHEKISFCYAEQKIYDKAIFHANQAVGFDPKNSTNVYILGQLYEHIEDYASAEKWIAEALDLMDQPLNAEYTKLATVLNRQGKHGEAIVALQKAVKENPQDETAQFFLVRTKDEYFADTNSKIKVYEVFKEKFPKSAYIPYADGRLRELKDEKFMKSK